MHIPKDASKQELQKAVKSLIEEINRLNKRIDKLEKK